MVDVILQFTSLFDIFFSSSVKATSSKAIGEKLKKIEKLKVSFPHVVELMFSEEVPFNFIKCVLFYFPDRKCSIINK